MLYFIQNYIALFTCSFGEDFSGSLKKVGNRIDGHDKNIQDILKTYETNDQPLHNDVKKSLQESVKKGLTNGYQIENKQSFKNFFHLLKLISAPQNVLNQQNKLNSIFPGIDGSKPNTFALFYEEGKLIICDQNTWLNSDIGFVDTNGVIYKFFEQEGTASHEGYKEGGYYEATQGGKKKTGGKLIKENFSNNYNGLNDNLFNFSSTLKSLENVSVFKNKRTELSVLLSNEQLLKEMEIPASKITEYKKTLSASENPKKDFSVDVSLKNIETHLAEMKQYKEIKAVKTSIVTALQKFDADITELTKNTQITVSDITFVPKQELSLTNYKNPFVLEGNYRGEKISLTLKEGKFTQDVQGYVQKAKEQRNKNVEIEIVASKSKLTELLQDPNNIHGNLKSIKQEFEKLSNLLQTTKEKAKLQDIFGKFLANIYLYRISALYAESDKPVYKFYIKGKATLNQNDGTLYDTTVTKNFDTLVKLGVNHETFLKNLNSLVEKGKMERYAMDHTALQDMGTYLGDNDLEQKITGLIDLGKARITSAFSLSKIPDEELKTFQKNYENIGHMILPIISEFSQKEEYKKILLSVINHPNVAKAIQENPEDAKNILEKALKKAEEKSKQVSAKEKGSTKTQPKNIPQKQEKSPREQNLEEQISDLYEKFTESEQKELKNIFTREKISAEKQVTILNILSLYKKYVRVAIDNFLYLQNVPTKVRTEMLDILFPGYDSKVLQEVFGFSGLLRKETPLNLNGTNFIYKNGVLTCKEHTNIHVKIRSREQDILYTAGYTLQNNSYSKIRSAKALKSQLLKDIKQAKDNTIVTAKPQQKLQKTPSYSPRKKVHTIPKVMPQTAKPKRPGKKLNTPHLKQNTEALTNTQYIVQSGDSIWNIAKSEYKLNNNTDIANVVHKISSLNDVGKYIHPGDTLKLPKELTIKSKSRGTRTFKI